MRLQTNEQGLLIDVLKCRGTQGGFSIALNHQIPSISSDLRTQERENTSVLSGLLAHTLAANS